MNLTSITYWLKYSRIRLTIILVISLTKERGLSLTNSSAAAIPIINWHTFIGATDWGSWQVLLIFLFVYPLYNKISFKQC